MPELTYFCGNVATSSFFFCPEVKVETYSDWNFYGRGVLWWSTLYLIMLCSFIIWLFWTQIKSHITWRASRVLKDETKALPTGEYLGLEHQNLASGKSMIYWRWTLVFASFLLPVFAVAPFALGVPIHPDMVVYLPSGKPFLQSCGWIQSALSLLLGLCPQISALVRT
jgi:hypothetical protein